MAVDPAAEGQAVVDARRDPGEPGHFHLVGAEGRLVGVPGRGLEPVRVVRQRLRDAHARSRRARLVATTRRAQHPVGQHTDARARQRRAADRA